MAKNRNALPPWTEADRFKLMDMIEQGRTNAEICAAFGMAESTLRTYRRRYGVPGRRNVLYSASRVGRMMGFATYLPVALWIERGWISATRVVQAWCVHPDELDRFLRDPRYWNWWELDAITDPVLKRRATAYRAAYDTMTVREVAARFCVADGTVRDWIRKGYLATLTIKSATQNEHLIERRVVESFQLPQIGGIPKGVHPRSTWKQSAAA